MGTTDVRKKATTVSLCECFRKTSRLLFLKSDHQNVFHVIIVERRRLFPLMLHCLRRPVASRRIGSCSPAKKKILAHFYSNKNIHTIPDEWDDGGGVERREGHKNRRKLVLGFVFWTTDERRDVSSIQQ